LRAKIDAFLAEQTDDDVLRNAQRQVRVSMGVIHDSLRRYGYVIGNHVPPSVAEII
jgi:FAD synthetase